MFKKNFSFLLLIIICLVSCSTGTVNGYNYTQPAFVGPSIGLGTIIAVVISWTRNKSILWAIVHGILGWFYIIYALIVGKKS